LHTFCHAVPERWHLMGVTQAAGLSLRWFRDNFGSGKDDGRDPYERLSEEAASVETGAEGAFWAPYLMGERTPHLDPSARAAFVGLTASHTRAHLIRAVMEGVAYSLKDSFTIFDEIKVPVQRIRLGGGGARSSVWRQIQADAYAHEIEIVEAEEGAAYGAAILAGVGIKCWASVDEASDAIVRVAKRVSPEKNNCERMRAGYQVYRRIYPGLRSIFA
jgi:xylulokinase